MQCEMFEGCCSERDFSSDMESQLMCMAYLAHRAILYEKIKQRIEHQEGEKLDKIAELLVEASKERQDIRKSEDRKRKELADKLKEAEED